MDLASIDCACGHNSCEHKGHYFVRALCTNCRWEGEARITKGHEAWRSVMHADCPRCKCSSIQAGEWSRDDTVRRRVPDSRTLPNIDWLVGGGATIPDDGIPPTGVAV